MYLADTLGRIFERRTMVKIGQFLNLVANKSFLQDIILHVLRNPKCIIIYPEDNGIVRKNRRGILLFFLNNDEIMI